MARQRRKESTHAKQRAIVSGFAMAGKTELMRDFARFYCQPNNQSTYLVSIDDREEDYDGFDLLIADVDPEKGEHLDARKIKDEIAKDAKAGVFKKCGCIIFDAISPIFDHEVRSVLDDKQSNKSGNYTGKANAMKFLIEGGKLSGLPVAYIIHDVVSGDHKGVMSVRKSISRIEQIRWKADLTLHLEVFGPATHEALTSTIEAGKIESMTGFSKQDLSKMKAGHYGVRINQWRGNMGMEPVTLWDEVGHFNGMWARIIKTLQQTGEVSYTWAEYASGKARFKDEDHAITVGFLHSENGFFPFGNPGVEAIRRNGERGVNGEANKALHAMNKLKRGEYSFSSAELSDNDMAKITPLWVRLVADKLTHQRKVLAALKPKPLTPQELKDAVGEEHTKSALTALVHDKRVTYNKSDGVYSLAGGAK